MRTKQFSPWLLTMWIVVASLASPEQALEARDSDLRDVQARDLSILQWRNIGPANMGGRVSAIALVPGSSTEFYVGFATGGLFKTSNLGVTFEPLFQHEETASIGAIVVVDAPATGLASENQDAGDATDSTEEHAEAMAKSRSEKGRGRIVWVGTGEGNGRNSSSWGNGVYRSTDGGGSFTHLGLAETHDIPALAVDPRNPDIAYVAALGHLWGRNKERGIFKTSDGGQTWQQVLKVDDQTGACDVVMDPRSTSTVYAAMYSRLRTPWSFEGVSDRGGIFRSHDGGQTWQKLTAGLPERTGRIGLTIFPGDTRILYAVIESDQGGTGRTAWDDRSPAGGLFRSEDRGETWTRVNELNFRPFYFSRVAVDPEDDQRVYMPGWDVAISDDGGRSFRRSGSVDVHVDHHAIVINPLEPRQILLGNDGGIYVSHDRGKYWDFLNHLAVGQFYHVDVDRSDPYRVGGGLQDNGSWIGPSESFWKTGSEGKPSILNEDWIFVHGGDGFRVAFDPADPHIIYATSQGGNLVRIHLDTMVRERLKAAPDEGQQKLRFNWDAPFLISVHDSTVLYHAGNKLFKLTERGRYWYSISDDLTRQDADRIMTEGSDAETYGTLTALAESPLQAGVLWTGSDDGLIHVSFDDGVSWRNVTPDKVDDLYVSHLEASHTDLGTAYAAIDGHRSDVFTPLILMTTNRGGKWQDISGDLPPGSPVRVVREDATNPEVLYCGTETSVYVTLDRGQHWLKLGDKSLPTVPVYDLVIQTREQDLVAGTHGRSIWILDDMSCLAQLTPTAAQQPLHLFDILPGRPRLYSSRGYGGGARRFLGASPQTGLAITYWLRDLPDQTPSVSIEDDQGLVVRTVTGTERPGLNRVVWDLQADKKHRFDNPEEGWLGQTNFVPPGDYKVVVSFGEYRVEKPVTVLPAPNWQDPALKADLPPPTPVSSSGQESDR